MRSVVALSTVPRMNTSLQIAWHMLSCIHWICSAVARSKRTVTSLRLASSINVPVLLKVSLGWMRTMVMRLPETSTRFPINRDAFCSHSSAFIGSHPDATVVAVAALGVAAATLVAPRVERGTTIVISDRPNAEYSRTRSVLMGRSPCVRNFGRRALRVRPEAK